MITYHIATTKDELQQILDLQHKNLYQNISEVERKQEGFLTVSHDLNFLVEMNDKVQHIIAKHNDKVVAYALSMHSDFANRIEILKPMFVKIDENIEEETNYIVMGQICIDKSYRGKGIFRNLYKTMQESLKNKFDYIITEVDKKNTRSINAHKAVNFKEFIAYYANNQYWSLISLKT